MSLVVIVVLIISMLINLFFVGRYYISEKAKVLDNVENTISEKYNLMTSRENETAIKEILNNIEEDNDVTIVYSIFDSNVENINRELVTKFGLKKIKLNKFWITEDTLEKLDDKSVNKIYDQGKTKYRVLTKFIKVDNYIIAVAIPVPYIDETIGFINKFNIYLMIFSIFIIVILVFILLKKIVKPLENLKELSKDIADLNFRKEEIKTNDEIEDLAISINSMSESLENAHKEINLQNENLKNLISDISHELKTPLALIKVYGQGIEDGMDDGTYMETIQEQIDRMDGLIERLLFWSKLDKKELKKSYFDLGKKTFEALRKYKLLMNDANIELILNIHEDEEYMIYGDEDSIDIALNNLITNSIKYTNNNRIEISMFKENNKIRFSIANGIEESSIENLENIWIPFYVLEKSRNKELSGTGLGLPIVKSILKNHNFDFGFKVKDNNIEFYIVF